MKLRERHQENAKYMKTCLKQAGIPILSTPSHIIAVPVGDPLVCAYISNELMARFGHYVQSINYPTVAKGQERLRLAPTPFHTKDMMHQLVHDLTIVWKENGLPMEGTVQFESITNKEYECKVAKRCLTCDLTFSEGELPCGAKNGCPQISVFA